jgi:hypothetical protein
MSPSPKHVSRHANIVETLSGNSWAMIEKLEVRKQAFPMASTDLTRKLNPIKVFVSEILS